MKPTVEERFWSHVDKAESGCWIWTSYMSPGGYGLFYTNGRQGPAHRFSWELHHGPIPAGMFVCHHCDVRPIIGRSWAHLPMPVAATEENKP